MHRGKGAATATVKLKRAGARAAKPRSGRRGARAEVHALADREVVGPLVVLADCEVYYEGRASSTLQRGHYLIIRKADGTFLVHGARLTTPANYQPAGSRLIRTRDGYLCRSRHESIRVVVHRELSRLVPEPWDDHRAELARTERQLCAKLAKELRRHVPGVVDVYPQFPTPLGAVDLVAVDAKGVFHVIEVKRARATVHAAVQLRKYLEALTEQGHRVRGYVAAPEIIASASAYCQKHGLTYLRVRHASSKAKGKRRAG